MHQIKSEYLDYQARRLTRPDWRRYVRPNSELAAFYERIERKYRPDQPRVPAGSCEGGQWTAEDSSSVNSGGTDPRVLSDAPPDDDWIPGAQYATNRPRVYAPVIINGRRIEPTPAEAARLAVAEAQSRDAILRVQELDPKWRPAPSQYESVEGLIQAHQAEAREAQGRIIELQRLGIGLGPFAGESISPRGPTSRWANVFN